MLLLCMPVTCRNVCNKREASSTPPPPKERKAPISQRNCYETHGTPPPPLDENFPPSGENPPLPKEIKTHRDFFPREVGDERLLLAP